MFTGQNWVACYHVFVFPQKTTYFSSHNQFERYIVVISFFKTILALILSSCRALNIRLFTLNLYGILLTVITVALLPPFSYLINNITIFYPRLQRHTGLLTR